MRERKNARQTFNFLMPACLIVCNCSYSFSLQLLFKQDIAWLYQCKLILTIAVFGCFTMKWVLWPNAPIIGGWAVLFTPRKYIFSYNFISTSKYHSKTNYLSFHNRTEIKISLAWEVPNGPILWWRALSIPIWSAPIAERVVVVHWWAQNGPYWLPLRTDGHRLAQFDHNCFGF